jgi:hypothetical protein
MRGMGFHGRFAQQQSETTNVRFGSLATTSGARADVRYYPQSDRDSDLPGGRYVPAADICNAANSPYSMISSAATSRPGGTATPSAFAVLRLMIVSNLVAACTGRSAGLSPRRMRST